jgi:hypothetical protein
LATSGPKVLVMPAISRVIDQLSVGSKQ